MEEFMSDTANPFQGPETAAVPEKPLIAEGGALTETMLIYLKQASPWLRFVGIFGFIGAGLTALSGFSFFAIIPAMAGLWGDIPGFEAFGDAFGAAFGGGMVVLFIAAAVLMVFPSLFMYRFGDKIRSYLRTGTEQDLEVAFRNNKSLWKFIGILCIIQLAFIPLTIIGTIVAVVIALAR
jgi:hypothetical protein